MSGLSPGVKRPGLGVYTPPAGFKKSSSGMIVMTQQFLLHGKAEGRSFLSRVGLTALHIGLVSGLVDVEEDGVK